MVKNIFFFVLSFINDFLVILEKCDIVECGWNK